MMELERGRVAHMVPGRVRIKIDPRALADERGVQLQRALLALPDVEEIRMTPRTGSVVVVYAPDALDTRGLLARVREARVLDIEAPSGELYGVQQVPLSETAQGLQRQSEQMLAAISAFSMQAAGTPPIAAAAQESRSFARAA